MKSTKIKMTIVRHTKESEETIDSYKTGIKGMVIVYHPVLNEWTPVHVRSKLGLGMYFPSRDIAIKETKNVLRGLDWDKPKSKIQNKKHLQAAKKLQRKSWEYRTEDDEYLT